MGIVDSSVGFLLNTISDGKWKRVLAFVLGTSITVEIIQYIKARGFCEIDDVIDKYIRCSVGTFLWKF